ncbi:ATP-binding cassette domain-containing protein [Brevibacterium casei]|nr:ATP-binding cassette domain-containing protein [Brevibacterium casei]
MPAGSTTAVIGRNGAGKTSLFEILIGALPAAAGSLRIGGTTVFDVAAGLWPPIHARGIVHLAQNPPLFPHLSVLDNVAYGLRARGEPAALARRHAADMLDRLGVGECASRQPDAVSGGRPPASPSPAPSSSILPSSSSTNPWPPSTSTCASRRAASSRRSRGRSALLITHDVADVTSLAETLVLIDSGRVDTVGAVGEIGHGDDTSGRDFLLSFCETDGEGILCSGSH